MPKVLPNRINAEAEYCNTALSRRIVIQYVLQNGTMSNAFAMLVSKVLLCVYVRIPLKCCNTHYTMVIIMIPQIGAVAIL